MAKGELEKRGGRREDGDSVSPFYLDDLLSARRSKIINGEYRDLSWRGSQGGYLPHLSQPFQLVSNLSFFSSLFLLLLSISPSLFLLLLFFLLLFPRRTSFPHSSLSRLGERASERERERERVQVRERESERERERNRRREREREFR